MTTIYDIAKAAGVTAATVSHVLSGKKPVKDATRKKVLHYVEEMGYRPNLVARSLTTQRTGTIGLVVPFMTNPFYAEIIDASGRISHRAGFRIQVTATRDDIVRGEELLEDLYAHRVDGIIVMGGSGGLPFSIIDTLIAQGLPILGCMWEEEEQHLTMNIGFDLFAGGRMVAEHLLSLGHQRIGIIAHGIPDYRLQHHLRVSGCTETLTAAGYPFDPELLIFGDSSLQSGEMATAQLLDRPDPPTAIFATNDLMAIGAILAAWKRGLHIPRDLSIVGFDNIEMSSYTTPPLTTISLDRVVLMEKAIEVLLSVIQQKHVTIPALLSPELVIRDSTSRKKE